MDNYWEHFWITFVQYPQQTYLKMTIREKNISVTCCTTTLSTFYTVVETIGTNKEETILFLQRHMIIKKHDFF